MGEYVSLFSQWYLAPIKIMVETLLYLSLPSLTLGKGQIAKVNCDPLDVFLI